MLGRRVRTTLLGLMALLLVGSYAASSAYAEASGGPYFYHRANAKEGKGVKIAEKAPETVQGKGGEQRLSTAGGTEVTSKEVKTKGIIYNNVNQGQTKIEETYSEPKLTKPSAPNCKVKIGTNNTVIVFGVLEWTWNGTLAQLLVKPQIKEQIPDWVFFAAEPKYTKAQEEAEELPEATAEFTKLHFEGAECAVLNGTSPKVTGSDAVASVSPKGLNEYSLTEKLLSEGPKGLQHDWFWWRGRGQGLKTGLLFISEASEYKGEFEDKTASQEVALFEE